VSIPIVAPAKNNAQIAGFNRVVEHSV
jgi:hypothetical protein